MIVIVHLLYLSINPDNSKDEYRSVIFVAIESMFVLVFGCHNLDSKDNVLLMKDCAGRTSVRGLLQEGSI